MTDNMRIDRILTLYLFRPLVQLVRAYAPRRLPILMYHSIANTPEAESRPYYRTTTSVRRFAEQMAWLKQSGWRGVTLSEGLAWLQKDSGARASQPPPFAVRPLVLTFDDGLRDFFTAAMPILREYGFSATMYLPTGLIANSSTPYAFNGKPCLTWAEVRTLQSEGIEFGSHTVSHCNLVKLMPTRIRAEIVDSKRALEEQLQSPAVNFAYPYAFPSERVAFSRALREYLLTAGYETCVTTMIGLTSLGDDPLVLKRLPINEGDDRALLQAKLMGAYNWMALAQCVWKAVRRRRDSSG
jgi:peptidoglycan/xylan/chitin deacetylase (PgdA/CDA1 family)